MSILLDQTYQDYIKTQNHREHIAKIEILDYYENVVELITDDIISGDITINNQNGSRRSATISLYNGHDKYTPYVRGDIWLNKKMRIYSGIKISGVEYYYSKGIFGIQEVQVISQFSDKRVDITLIDKMSFIDGNLGGTLEAPYIINSGSSLSSAVLAILNLIGEVKYPYIYASATPTPYQIIKEAGDTYNDLLTDLSGLYSFDYFYDENGSFHFQPAVDPNTVSSVWDFDDSDVTYLGMNHRYKFDSVKNIVYVYGNNISGTQVKAVAYDNNIFSTTYVGLIGQRPMVVEDEIISTTQQALDRANYELRKNIVLQELVDMETIPIDTLNETDVVTINDSTGGTYREKYFIQQMNFPLLSKGNMQMSCWKVRSVT